eukprot:872825-Pyramimonas_sp.AAC.1
MTEALLMKREMYNLRLRDSIMDLLPTTDLFGLNGSARRGVALYRKCAVVRHSIWAPQLAFSCLVSKKGVSSDGASL